YVQVEGIPSPEAIDTLQKGVTINIKGKLYHTQPCHASIVTAEPNLPPRTPPIRFRKSVPDCWLSLTLTEGKNRQVRHITAAVGHPTLRLVRYAIDNITINGLLPGNYRPLSPAEVKGLLAWRSP
ncbi:MAG: pseudouridine synthase, partial [Chitinophagia bacterium]|nr:pseudouridine synthase [Chitinophagia bacterium]